MNTLLLIDGNAIMHRAYYALPPFKTKDGIPTNVIYGFFTMLHKAVIDFKPNYIVVCFDTPAPTFRKKLFLEYQAQRPQLVSDFKTQIPSVKDALDEAGIFHIEKDGFEADDLIGTISHWFKNNGIRVLILSGDRDILQLVDRHVFVISPQVGLSSIKLYDLEEVKKKYNLPPEKIPDLKALMGDPSDNYPGAKGIGPKTAAKLIQEFSSIEQLLKKIDKVEEKTRKILKDSKKDILLAKKLATIITDMPLDLDLKKAKFEGFHNRLREYFEKFEMRSLIKRLFNEEKATLSKTKKTDNIDKDQMGLF